MDLKRYYSDLKTAKESLQRQFPNGDCLVSSLANANASVAEVPITIAARLLVEGSHKLADDSEVATYRAAQTLQQRETTDPIAQFRKQLDLLSGGSE